MPPSLVLCVRLWAQNLTFPATQGLMRLLWRLCRKWCGYENSKSRKKVTLHSREFPVRQGIYWIVAASTAQNFNLLRLVIEYSSFIKDYWKTGRAHSANVRKCCRPNRGLNMISIGVWSQLARGADFYGFEQLARQKRPGWETNQIVILEGFMKSSAYEHA